MTRPSEPAPADRPSAAYPYLVSVRGTSPAVPARKEGRYYWLRHETYLGVVWPLKDIAVLGTFDAAAASQGCLAEVVQERERAGWMVSVSALTTTAKNAAPGERQR